MKKIIYAVLAVVVCACAQPKSEAATGETTGTTVTAAASETSASAAATDTTATTAEKAQEAKPMTDYTNKVAELHTSAGEIDIRFFPDVAPNHVKNFIDLSQQGFYNGVKFHRVIPGFMIQGGDPNTKTDNTSTWGTGGSGTNVKAEFNKIPHKRGIVSMARSQSPDSASSQFFIVVADSAFLDNNYTVFGEVTKGMDVADKIVNAQRDASDRPYKPVSIDKVTIREATPAESGPTPK